MNKQMITMAKKAMKKYKICVDEWLAGSTDFSGRVPKMDKIRTLQENNIDVMIEDNPDVAEECANAKITCIYIPARHARSINNPYIHEVEDWVEIYQTIKKLDAKGAK